MENMNTWRLSLYIDNSREIYSITESLSNSLAKKSRRALNLVLKLWQTAARRSAKKQH